MGRRLKLIVVIFTIAIVAGSVYYLLPIYHYNISRDVIKNPKNLTIEETIGLFFYYSDNCDLKIDKLWTAEQQDSFSDNEAFDGKDVTTIKSIRHEKDDKSEHKFLVEYKSKKEKHGYIEFTLVQEQGEWKISSAGRG
mgnify:CR=1 FL=1